MCGEEKIHQGVTGAAESYAEIGEDLDGTILFEERPDTSCPLETGDPYPPVAAVQDRGQGRGEVRLMITIFTEHYTLQLENPGFTLGPSLENSRCALKLQRQT